MPGQFKTRRGAGGRLEKIPAAEQKSLKAAAEAAPTMADFIKPATDTDLPEPVRQPKVIPKPKETGVDVEAAEKAGEKIDPVVATAAGAAMGGASGGLAGAAVGAATAFVVSKIINAPDPIIGTLEGGHATSQDNTLRDLLAVQQKIARVGSPIKGAANTSAVGSRM